MDIYKTKDVFTPTTYAKLTYVERKPEISDRLFDALTQQGMQIVIYGPSGSGKSTLVQNKLRQIYEDHIDTKCTSATTYDQLLLSAFDKLDRYYVAETGEKKTRGISTSMSSSYLNIKNQISATVSHEKTLKLNRVVPPQLTGERLAGFLGEAECAWLLEDFHKVQRKDKTKLSELMKTFMDSAHTYPYVKIVAIGAVASARQVIEHNKEMRGRVAEIEVPLMGDEEIREILVKGEQLLNLNFDPAVKQNIVRYSCQLPQVVHQLALNICLSKDILRTQEECVDIQQADLDNAVRRYLQNSSDTLITVFSKALKRQRQRKYDNCRIILQTLAYLPLRGATYKEILEEIRKDKPDYPPGNLTFYLQQLRIPARGEIVRLDSYSRKYAFSDPFYKAYAMCVFKSSRKGQEQLEVEWCQERDAIVSEIFESVQLILGDLHQDGF